MRCTKCGKMVALANKFCIKCGTPITPAQRKIAVILLSILGVLIAATLVACALYVYYHLPGRGDDHVRALTKISLTVTILTMVGFSMVINIVEYIRYIIRRPISGLISLAIILIIIGFFGSAYIFSGRGVKSQQFISEFATIQENLNEVAAAKIMGDTIASGKPMPGAFMMRVEAVAQMASDRLSGLTTTPKALLDYRQAAINWTNNVVAAAKDKTLWPDLTDQPGDFKLTLTDAQAKMLLASSTQIIAELKEFGDTAVARGDRDAMRYIAGKLLVQEHWINGIMHSKKAGLFSFNLIEPALAQTLRTIQLDIKGPDIERPNIGSILRSAQQLREAATGFTNGLPNAKATWNKTTKGLTNSLLNNQTGTAKISPTVQKFYDACKAKGGKIGGDSSKDRLPTTEFGYTCELKQGDKVCWDYLTYSGGSYSGGGSGCPEKNLLPKEEESKDGGPWDGTYTEYGNVPCSGNVPGLPAALPAKGTVVVKNNQLTEDGKQVATVNGSGLAARNQSFSRTNSVTNPNTGEVVSYTTNASGITYGQFYKQDKGGGFKGYISATFNLLIPSRGEVFTTVCQGNFGGNKIK